MSRIIFSILCLSASMATARWSGSWLGPAHYENNYGDTHQYKKLNIVLAETEGNLTFKMIIDNWQRVLEFQKIGSDLIFNQKVVGHMDDKTLSFSGVPVKEYGWNLIYSLSLEKNSDQSLGYSDKTFWDYTMSDWDTTAGVLKLQNPARAKSPEVVPGEYLVKLKPAYRSYLQKANFSRAAKELQAEVKSAIVEGGILVVRKPQIQTIDSAVKELLLSPMVEVAEPNFVYHAVRTPNDPLNFNLWGFHNEGKEDPDFQVGVAGVDIEMRKAWDLETGSKNVIVAVIDTGVNYPHPDLRENMWVNETELRGQPGVDDDQNGYIDDIHGMRFVDDDSADPRDDHGHGSHCAGTIGAHGNDGIGMSGINWNVTILPVKFLTAEGSGTTENAIRSVDYALKMKAQVLSNSWGGDSYSVLMEEAIRRAHDAGALFVAAAGNDGSDNDEEPHYPSNYNVPNVVAVAAIDNRGRLAGFSNYGKKSVHLAAPGVHVYSTFLYGYNSFSGTSMATPHVAGVAALLFAHEPQLGMLEVRQRLLSTTREYPSLIGRVESDGMLNAFQALSNKRTH